MQKEGDTNLEIVESDSKVEYEHKISHILWQQSTNPLSQTALHTKQIINELLIIQPQQESSMHSIDIEIDKIDNYLPIISDISRQMYGQNEINKQGDEGLKTSINIHNKRRRRSYCHKINEEYYYLCLTCSATHPSYDSTFCQQCFMQYPISDLNSSYDPPQHRHSTHQFIKIKNKSSHISPQQNEQSPLLNDLRCRCGRLDLVRQQGFCSLHHQKFIQQYIYHNNSMINNKYEELKQIFGILFDMVLYLDLQINENESQIHKKLKFKQTKNNVATKIYKKLISLCELSDFYIELVTQLLFNQVSKLPRSLICGYLHDTEQINDQSEGNTGLYFEYLIYNLYDDHLKKLLIEQLSPNMKSKKIIIKALFKINNNKNQNQKQSQKRQKLQAFFSQLRQDLFDIKILQWLVNEQSIEKDSLHFHFEDHAERNRKSLVKLNKQDYDNKGINLNSKFNILYFISRIQEYLSFYEKEQGIWDQQIQKQATLEQKSTNLIKRISRLSQNSRKSPNKQSDNQKKQKKKSKNRSKLTQIQDNISYFYNNEIKKQYLTSQFGQLIFMAYLATYPSIQDIKEEIKESQNDNFQDRQEESKQQDEQQGEQGGQKEKGEQGEQGEQKEQGEVLSQENLKQNLEGQQKQQKIQNNQIQCEQDEQDEQDEQQELGSEQINLSLSLPYIIHKHSSLEEQYDDLPEAIKKINKQMLQLLSIASGASFNNLYHNKYMSRLLIKYKYPTNGANEPEYIQKQNQNDFAAQQKHELQLKMQSFLYWICLHTKQICYYEDKYISKKQFLIIATSIVSFYQKKQGKLFQHVKRIWKTMLEGVFTNFCNIADQTMQLLRLLLRADLNMISYKAKLSNQYSNEANLTRQEKQVNMKEDKYMQEWLINLLKVNHKLGKNSFIMLKENGLFSFGNKSTQNCKSKPGQILEEYSIYIEQEDLFVNKKQLDISSLTFQQKYKYFLLDFPISSDPYDVKHFYNAESSCMYYQNEQKISENPCHIGPICIKLMSHFINFEIILQCIGQKWNQYLNRKKQREEGVNSQLQEYFSDEIQEKCGYLYLFVLVQLDKLGWILRRENKDQQDPDLKWKLFLTKKLRQIHDDTIKMLAMSTSEQQVSLIQKLFYSNNERPKIQQTEEKQNKQTNIEQKKQQEERKEKHRNKKQLMRKKYLQNQNTALAKFQFNDKIQEKDSEQVIQDTDLCIICHEHSKPQNQLVYLANLIKDKLLTSIYHGFANSLSQTLIRCCFHTLHIFCFTKMRDQKPNLVCPLCSKPTNFILPRKNSVQQTRRICQNILINTLALSYKIYDYQNKWDLYTKHLVQSLGLGSLVNPYTINCQAIDEKNPNWTKIDFYIFQNLKYFWEKCNKVDKQNCLNLINNFIFEIQQKCFKEPNKCIQILICRAILYYFEEKQMKEDKIQTYFPEFRTLENILEGQQVKIIRNNIQKLIKTPIVTSQLFREDNMQNSQKISLKFKTINLPFSSIHANRMLMISSCTDCKSNTFQLIYNQLSLLFSQQNEHCTQICLMCGEVICQNCIQDTKHWEKNHNEFKISLRSRDLKLSSSLNGVLIKRNIYYNDFMVAYEKRSKIETAQNDICYLSDVKLQKVLAEILNML